MNGATPARVVDPGVRAFCDESIRWRAAGAGIYLMSAVLLEPDGVGRVRDTMAALLLPGQRKLHWHDERAGRRLSLVRQMASVESEVLIATWCGMDNDGQERARRKSQQTLLTALAGRGVTGALFESRGSTRDKHDGKGLAGLRKAGTLPKSLRVEHLAGSAEQALWAADIAVGAFGTALDGTSEYWSELLAGKNVTATVLTCGRCFLPHGPDAARESGAAGGAP